MTSNYKPRGVCASNIAIEVDGDIIKNVEYAGGCPGNLVGISQLVKGMKVNDVIAKFEGIKCGNKQTSCPDQLAQALKAMVN